MLQILRTRPRFTVATLALAVLGAAVAAAVMERPDGAVRVAGDDDRVAAGQPQVRGEVLGLHPAPSGALAPARGVSELSHEAAQLRLPSDEGRCQCRK